MLKKKKGEVMKHICLSKYSEGSPSKLQNTSRTLELSRSISGCPFVKYLSVESPNQKSITGYKMYSVAKRFYSLHYYKHCSVLVNCRNLTSLDLDFQSYL